MTTQLVQKTVKLITLTILRLEIEIIIPGSNYADNKNVRSKLGKQPFDHFRKIVRNSFLNTLSVNPTK